MLARARSQAGFTTIELLLAVLISTVGVISLVGTLDVSRRVTTYSEMKEAASHVAEQKMEELRALDYGELALDGERRPRRARAIQTTPPTTCRRGGTSYRLGSAGERAAIARRRAARDRRDRRRGRLDRGGVERRAAPRHGPPLCHLRVATAADDCDQGADTSAYKRIIVAVTVENALGPQKPIMVSTLVGDPDLANGEGANPTDNPEHLLHGPGHGTPRSSARRPRPGRSARGTSTTRRRRTPRARRSPPATRRIRRSRRAARARQRTRADARCRT